MTPRSIYTPEGTFDYVMLVVGLTLVAAVGYLLVFTNATAPL